ncbi:MAG: MGMT family protein [Alphaproteobacteria bacterium]|jgi:methylated-DNA-protein-cysteine methyltransferase related protein|nr:methyltransferase [Rhodospirillaceae bacterium]MBT6509485.1 methyltransferase [Rhodospirillaceae bacterium]MBT7614946.1 methyltransferase [Rhodospirillaceae bacterium]MBT7647087.1 methyltransferase [Rhodospirillaceae bacterium]MDG2482922.1 MGMT family protein [Alphaproteobacteria bacterium]
MASEEYEGYYAVIRAIPEGRIMTYGDVAKASGHPRWARRVGYALSSLNDLTVPWWRVINAKGQISRGGGRTPEGVDQQRDLLEVEGVYIDLEGKVDLDAFRHIPPAPKK